MPKQLKTESAADSASTESVASETDPAADDSAVATLDPPAAETSADTTTLAAPAPEVVRPTDGVPKIGDKVYLYLADQSKPVGPQVEVRYAMGCEAATVIKVHCPGDPTSTLGLRVDYEVIEAYPMVQKNDFSSTTRLNGRFCAVDEDGEVIRRVPETMPPIGCTNVAVWLPTDRGIKPVRGRVVGYTKSTGIQALYHEEGDPVVATPDSRAELGINYGGDTPGDRTWGWEPLPGWTPIPANAPQPPPEPAPEPVPRRRTVLDYYLDAE